MPRKFLLALAVLALSGCANFKAVSQFAGQTATMTGVIKSEFSQLEEHCVKQAGLVAAVNNIGDDGPFKNCSDYKKAQGELAAVTVTVLDAYAKALTSLADDKAFDLSPDIQTLSGKIGSLKDSSGNSLVNADELGAITKVVDLLVDVWASSKREEAINRMVAEAPSLRITGGILRSYFVESPNAPLGRARAPYTNLVAIAATSVNSTEASLTSSPMRNAEPIRTFELLQDVKARKAFLAARGAKLSTASPPSGSQVLVQAQIAQAIDAWLSAVDTFATDALKPDSIQLYERLKVLREKTLAARDAISAT